MEARKTAMKVKYIPSLRPQTKQVSCPAYGKAVIKYLK